MRPMQSATGFQPVGPEANNAGASPNLDQPQYDAPNGAYAPQAPALPSDYGPVATAYQNTVRMHRTRGILPVLLATLPLMALAAACPMGAGIAASMLDGLLYGAGDAVIGINPASDSLPVLAQLNHMLDDIIQRFAIPTQSCILTHVTNTLQLIERGAPVDLVFQSVAGTEAANSGFGINLALLQEAREAALSLNQRDVF